MVLWIFDIYGRVNYLAAVVLTKNDINFNSLFTSNPSIFKTS